MHDLCKLYEKAGGINEIEQEQIMAAPRGRAFVVTGPTSRATIQIETPKAIEDMFSKPGYEGRFYAGRNEEWNALVEESRIIRATEKLAILDEEEFDAEIDTLPNFRSGAVQLIEVDANDLKEQDEAEIVLIEETQTQEDVPVIPVMEEKPE